MRTNGIAGVIVAAVVFSSVMGVWRGGNQARADELEVKSQLSGRVLDATHGGPVEGVLVMVAGPGGFLRNVTTDHRGRYGALVPPGLYRVIFAHGESRTSGSVTVSAGRGAALDGRVDSIAGEVIEVEGKVTPPVAPKPTNFSALRAPPYSDRAVLTDAWTKAWVLIDIDERGQILRFKFLKRPGYDLEQIAQAEVRRLRFAPARNGSGKPMRSLLVWPIEWPSAGWLTMFMGTRSAMPKVVGFPPQRQDHYVPCAGSGPLQLSSVHPTYKDCSKPDLSKAAGEPWILF